MKGISHTEDGSTAPDISELVDSVKLGKLVARIVNKRERIHGLKKLNVKRLQLMIKEL